MRVKRLKMENFRGFKELSIDFPEKGCAVLIGVNGAGKSSILECLKIFLSYYTNQPFDEGQDFRRNTTLDNWIDFSAKDVHADETETINQVIFSGFQEGLIEETDLPSNKRGYSFTYPDNTPPFYSALRYKIWPASLLRNKEAAAIRNIPICIYYDTARRIVERIPSEENKRFLVPQYEACYQAIQKESKLEKFISWFVEESNIENQLKIEKEDFLFRNPRLEVVRTGMKIFLDQIPNAEFGSIKIGVGSFSAKFEKKQTLLVEKGGTFFEISQLSEGERMTLAMVMDIGFRLAVANPSLEDPLAGYGVVCIDELELHLHPAWQRAIMPSLEKTFPNIQFIVSTHSPQILSNISNENIFVLENFEVVQNTPHTFGRDSNSILYDLFNVKEKPAEAEREFDQLYKLIDTDKEEEARALFQEMEVKYGSDYSAIRKAKLDIEFLMD